MDYRTLIVQAEAGDDGRSRIELALALALHFKAMLVGVAARNLVPLIPMMAIPGNPPGSGTLLSTEEQEIRAGLDAAEQLFRTLAEGTGACIGWRSRIAVPVSVLVHEARTADLYQPPFVMTGFHQPCCPKTARDGGGRNRSTHWALGISRGWAEAGTRRRQLVQARGPGRCPHAGGPAHTRRAARPVVPQRGPCRHCLVRTAWRPVAPSRTRCRS